MNNRNKDGLGELIRQVVKAGADWIGRLKHGHAAYGSKGSDPDIIDMPQPPAVYDPKPGVKVGGILLAIVGFVCGGASFLWSLLLLLGAAVLGDIAFGMGLFGANLLLVGACMALGIKGISMAGSVNRFSTYVKTIGQEELCNISKLASRIGKSQKYVVKDVEKMIQKGWFCQGHLDDKKTCLMVTDQMYREYQKLENERSRLREEERRKENLAKQERKQKKEQTDQSFQPQKTNGKLPEEARKILEQGAHYVNRIRVCNQRIPGEVISVKIDRMELLVSRIFDRLEQNPEHAGDLRKLTDYYLPTTIKLLETYAEMDGQPTDGENIRKTKQEIEESLDTINASFEKLLDDMFRETAWDVSSDISVLKTVLAQEGLGEDGWKKQ